MNNQNVNLSASIGFIVVWLIAGFISFDCGSSVPASTAIGFGFACVFLWSNAELLALRRNKTRN